jgi:hypothetical protein
LVSVFELERAAARLRRDLQAAALPEIKLLCALRFAESLRAAPGTAREPYVREFISELARAAEKCNPREFLPDETEALERLVALLREEEAWQHNSELAALSTLAVKAAGGMPALEPSADAHSVYVNALFVEHYPDLDLPPRGRLLTLRVTATPLPGRVREDDVVVRNPVSEPDDRFLVQARDSVAAARAHLVKRFGWRSKRHYRFDFAVESTGARFTGDSLGVAFAAGAVAALAKIEAFRERITVHPQVAFCGALSADGTLASVDMDALKRKIYRGFHSHLKVVVVPRGQITAAWHYLKTLETTSPGRRIELMGADDLMDVAGDPRLLPARRLSIAPYMARRAWNQKRLRWAEVPLLIVLAYAATCAVFPKARWWFDWDPTKVRTTAHGLEVLNSEQQVLWAIEYDSELDPSDKACTLGDLDGDGHPEVAFMPYGTQEKLEGRNSVFVYSQRGSWVFTRPVLLFSRLCTLPGRSPDNDSLRFQPQVQIIDTGGGSVLVTRCYCNEPARSHIRMWSAVGDSIGWYFHSGAVSYNFTTDQDGDGRLELVWTGVNNRADPPGAVLFVLRPAGTHGVSPPHSAGRICSLSSVERGNEVLYMQFPPTDITRIFGPYNSTGPLQKEGDSLWRLDIYETSECKQGRIQYYLGPNLKLVRASADDQFKALRGSVDPTRGLRPVPDWLAYDESCVEAVRYWSDSGWVTEGQLRAAGL